MKKPKTPPEYWNLYEKIKEGFIKIISEVSSPLYKGAYIHWDDFLHKKIISDLTLEEYWFGLKYQRSSIKKEIPLHDEKIQPFSFVLTEDIFSALHAIDMNAAGNLETLFPATINPEDKEKYLISSLIEEAITSSQIEGAITTRKVAKEMIRSGRNPRDISEKMILNNYLTMKRITEIKNQKLTPELVLEIHELITRDTLEDETACGRLRTVNEKIEVGDEISGETFHIPPDASNLKNRLDLLCSFANKETDSGFIHPVLRAIIVHFWLAYEHPFVDGNGRTARALFYWSMLNSEYWLFEYISISQVIKDSKIKYYKSFLYTETDQNDLTYFIIYHLETIDKSMKALGRYLEKKTKEIKKLEKEMRYLTQFNHRQKALLNHALKHPLQSYTYQSHATSHDVARQTARTDILQLEELGLLVTTGADRKRKFQPARDLHEKLKNLGAS